MGSFPPETYAAIGASLLFAALIKGTTGLGFSTSALPFLTLAVGLERALPLVLIPSITSNVVVMVDAGHFRSTVRRFWPMYIAVLPGIALGLWFLVLLEGLKAAAVLGAVLIGYSLFALGRPNLTLRARLERPLAAPVGLLTGAVNGLTGSQVMPILPYLMALKLSPNRFIQAINISFTLSSLAMAAGLVGIGFLTVEIAIISAIGLLPVWFGVWAGGKLRRRIAPDTFRRLVLILLLIFGAVLIARTLLSQAA